MPTDRRPTQSKWNDKIYVQAYRLACEGLSDPRIAQCLGVLAGTLNRWKRDRPALKDALELARANTGNMNMRTFQDYVYERLPTHLQEIWERIQVFDEDRINGHRLIEMLLDKHGKRARQHLYVHAIVMSNFNRSEALRKLCLTKQEVDGWIQYEPEFGELIKEIIFHKKNFFESALIEGVKRGDTAMTIFANKTLNKDIYSSDQNINVQHDHQHSVLVSIEELDPWLDLETKKKLLEAMRMRDQNKIKMIPKNQIEVRDSTDRSPLPLAVS